MSLPITELGRLITRKRGNLGIRAAAAHAEVSPATLSRVENGHLPDLATFAKICRWLDVDPAQFLGIEKEPKGDETVERAVVHFRKKPTVTVETANSLGALILAAQRARKARSDLIGGN
ncbi:MULTISPECIES: helix-turn-helix domain-containing protein [Rhizobium]|uniref:helix-turn-helix domain-containing protein n=1 Tax=Rhizobium TaxID=379 RepID=UPI00103B35BF|nr:transcriptional regulator [Rhizobium leguminosarum]NKL98012.1 helix-turn-helix domain-containing protein [Rhizobium leguminosarum bv. viciae]TBZ98700.1 transcriptional regulator [Rhizobium leguminosarum bv. viciae]UFW77839.1 helix-turn-helix transcriptional regulator [Rhizobium leguminosarum bv. viciae]